MGKEGNASCGARPTRPSGGSRAATRGGSWTASQQGRVRTRGQPSAPGDGFSMLRPRVPGRRSGGHARGKPQTCAGQGGVKPSRPRGPAAGRPGGRRARVPARPPRGSLRGPCLGRSPRCGTGTGEGSAEATPPGLPSGVREAREPLPLTPRAPAHAGKAGRRGCHARAGTWLNPGLKSCWIPGRPAILFGSRARLMSDSTLPLRVPFWTRLPESSLSTHPETPLAARTPRIRRGAAGVQRAVTGANAFQAARPGAPLL